jgi:hypothetical protein
MLSRLGDCHGTMGCRLGSAFLDGVLACGQAHGRVLLRVLVVVSASHMRHGYIRSYGAATSRTHDAGQHHQAKGIVGLVS